MALLFIRRILGAFYPRVKPPVTYLPPQFSLPLPDRPRILILKLDHIGDMIIGMRAFHEVRNAWPNAEITLVCSPTNLRLAEGMRIFDKVVGFKFFEERSHIQRPLDAVLAEGFCGLELPRFDIAIDLRYDADTRFLLEHVDARYICGFFAPMNRPLDVMVPAPEIPPQKKPRHLRSPSSESRLLSLMRTVIDAFRQEKHPLHALVSNDTSGLPAGKPYAVLCPASGAEIKQWPNKNFATVGRALIDAGLAVVLAGDQTMQADCAEIAELIGAQDVFDLSGDLPLEKLPTALIGAKLFIGNDSGPGHMAAALDIPTIVIFSGTPNIDIWHPRGTKAIAIKAPIACSPCHHASIAACRHERRCLTAISPAYVVEKAMELYRAEAERVAT